MFSFSENLNEKYYLNLLLRKTKIIFSVLKIDLGTSIYFEANATYNDNETLEKLNQSSKCACHANKIKIRKIKAKGK